MQKKIDEDDHQSFLIAKVIVNDFDLLRENISWSVVELIYNIPGKQISVILFITTKSFNKDPVSLFLES